ncbi:polysaccharide biosynthesis C-terminal domain-containing protein [Glaciecola sp. SC05]|uniref:polysaccharide biosynthesis C-terminal domain-containing protein n=1 Tax=Glaciecola sp. SC05 TaxID=1987355 RepID=UPI0035286426
MLRTLVTGAAYNIINILVQVLLGLIVFREMLLHFGEKDFGSWTLIFAILAHISLFEFGLGSLISKLVPVLSGDHAKVNKSYFSTAFFSMSIIAVFFLVLIAVIALFIEQSTIEFESSISFGALIFLLGVNFVFLFHTGAFHAYLSGSFKIGRLNAVRLTVNITRALVIIYLLQTGYGVIEVAIVFAFTSVAEFCLLLALSIRAGIKNSLDVKTCNRESLHYVIKRGSKLLFLRVNSYTRNNAAIIVCGLILGPILIVPLRIAGRLMEIYVEISTSLNYLLTPYFSSLSLGEESELNKNFLISIVCSTLLSVIIFLNIVCFGNWFLTLWLGDVPKYTNEILHLLAIGFCLANSQGPCNSILISKDKDKALMLLCITEVVVLLTLLFPATQHFGVTGAAGSVLISMLVSRVLVQPIIVCNVLNISYLKYLASILIPLSICSLSLYLLYEAVMLLELNSEHLSAISFFILQGLLVASAGIIFFSKRRS